MCKPRCLCITISLSFGRIIVQVFHSASGATLEAQRTLVWEKHVWVSLSIYRRSRLWLRWVEHRKMYMLFEADAAFIFISSVSISYIPWITVNYLLCSDRHQQLPAWCPSLQLKIHSLRGGKDRDSCIFVFLTRTQEVAPAVRSTRTNLLLILCHLRRAGFLTIIDCNSVQEPVIPTRGLVQEYLKDHLKSQL